MRFRPCIDLHNGKVKQIVGATLSDGGGDLRTNFETDEPASFFSSMYRRDGLPGGHVIMLGPGNMSAAKEALRAFPQGLQIGGGITDENARSFLDEGASHVIVTSYIFSGGVIGWERLCLLEKAVGKSRIVLDLSCRKTAGRYLIASDRWQHLSAIELTDELLKRLSAHCDEFLVHAIDVEGTRQGIDGALVQFLAAASPIPATYAGGIRSLADLDEVQIRGNDHIDATIGSALDIFGGTLQYADVLAWHRSQAKHP